MTLYSHSESNIRKTWFLVTVFLVFIIALGWLFSYLFKSSAILIIAVVFSVLTSIGGYWYSDKIVLRMSRAQAVEKKDYPELYRIVENLAITAGLASPKLYLLREKQPNAFAAGRDEKHALVVVTEGLLDKLERVELEGVIAHELSHIRNKDMLLQTLAVVLAGTIAIASNIFLRMSIFGGRGSNKKGGGGALLMILGLAAAILAPIAATMIKLAISRKREYLADASGALLTRYPEGLARALEKISADSSPIRYGASNSTAHLFIANPFKGKERKNWFSKLFMTHPPIEERLKALRKMSI